MSAEEAIKKLTDRPISSKNEIIVDSDFIEAIKLAIAALRAQKTKMDRSRFGCEWCGFAKRTLSAERRIAYCEKCGCPLTEAAWAELERRINGGAVD